MRRSSHLTHWFFGRLKNRFICRGRFKPLHEALPMGTPYGAGELQRLDRAKNPDGLEVPIPGRRTRSWYENKYGMVWCDSSSGRPDGCGRLCWPIGAYRYGTEQPVQIFKCLNQECKRYYGYRLRHRGGKVVPIKSERRTSLPVFAQRCPYCGGATIRKGSKGVSAGQIQVVCKTCRKISYFSEQGKKQVQPPRRGGPLTTDSNRPNCPACRHPMIRTAFTWATYKKIPLRVPLPVRRRLEGFSGEPSDIAVVHYYCREHRSYRFSEFWKREDGELLWKRRPGRKLPRRISARRVQQIL